MVPNDRLLQYLTLDASGVLVFSKRIPHTQCAAGEPVPITTDTAKPHYLIAGRRYPPPTLLAALQSGDHTLLGRKPQDPRPPKARDLEILDAIRTGDTYEEVGIRFGITRQRVKQILDSLAGKGYEVPSTIALRAEVRAQAQQEYAVARYGAHAEVLAENPELRAYLGARLTRIKLRALRQGLPFAMTVSDLYPLPETCPVLGTPLVYNGPSSGALDDYLSIDRIVPELGYVPGNVVLVSARANRLKNDATLAEIAKLAAFYREDNPKINTYQGSKNT